MNNGFITLIHFLCGLVLEYKHNLYWDENWLQIQRKPAWSFQVFPFGTHPLFDFQILPCLVEWFAGWLNENGQLCQATVGKHGGGCLTFSQSRLDVSPQWPAVQPQLMCAPPCKAFIGSVPYTQLTGETQTHTLLWFCLTRLSHTVQTWVPPCYSRY